jgi:hypothetical protein
VIRYFSPSEYSSVADYYSAGMIIDNCLTVVEHGTACSWFSALGSLGSSTFLPQGKIISKAPAAEGIADEDQLLHAFNGQKCRRGFN